jgi:type III pantothenate kinase
LDLWLALVIGNSRYHWGLFDGQCLLKRWDTPHYSADQLQMLKANHFSADVWARLAVEDLPQALDSGPEPFPVWVAAVVDEPLAQLADYPGFQAIDLHRVPIQHGYATLGVDRALALLGGGVTFGWPVLVIDCGTAMTFTAGVEGSFWGGAILPGLGLQFRALHNYTARLPLVMYNQQPLPNRWANTTPEGIQSGIIYTLLAGVQSFIADWRRQFPESCGLLTGGDSPQLSQYLTHTNPELADWLQVDQNLIFWGLRASRQQLITNH